MRVSSLLKNGCREPRETSDFPHVHGSAGASPSLFQQAVRSRNLTACVSPVSKVRSRENCLLPGHFLPSLLPQHQRMKRGVENRRLVRNVETASTDAVPSWLRGGSAVWTERSWLSVASVMEPVRSTSPLSLQASCFFRPTSVRMRSASRAASNGFRNVSLNGVRSKPLAVSSSLNSATNTASA